MPKRNILLTEDVLSSPTWADLRLWRLWCWCLLSASSKHRVELLEEVPVRVGPGQLAASMQRIRQETGLSTEDICSSLTNGKELGLFLVRPLPWGVRIEVVDWQRYRAMPSVAKSSGVRGGG